MRFRSALALALAAAFPPAAAQRVAEPLRSFAQPESKLWLEGTTNIGSWSCQANAFEAYVELDTTDAPRAFQRIELKVAVRALDCGNKRMTADIYRALRDTGSTPAYVVGQFAMRNGAADDTAAVHVAGTLTVAGVARPIALDLIARRRADGTREAAGVVPLLMTDYGVTPPRAMFGLIRARDALQIRFDLFFPSAP
jgi:polyisoprenoid-binding protein YceI